MSPQNSLEHSFVPDKKSIFQCDKAISDSHDRETNICWMNENFNFLDINCQPLEEILKLLVHPKVKVFLERIHVFFEIIEIVSGYISLFSRPLEKILKLLVLLVLCLSIIKVFEGFMCWPRTRLYPPSSQDHRPRLFWGMHWRGPRFNIFRMLIIQTKCSVANKKHLRWL